MREDYIRTARAKGLSERRVVLHHGVRSAINPILTILALDIATLLGGAILVEVVFNIPGIGLLAYTAIRHSDLLIVQGTVLLGAMFIIVANIVVDIAYAYLDPRVRYEVSTPPASPSVERRGPARRVPDRGRRGESRRRDLLRGGARTHARGRRRVGLGQDRRGDDDPRPDARAGGEDQRADPVRGARPAEPGRGGAAEDQGQRDRDDLPGPLDGAASAVQGRRADRRGGARPPGRDEGAGPRARDRAAGARRDPRPGNARRRLPARVLGRDAPARDDRDGARERAEAADRGRADDRARRDRAGADPRAAGTVARGAGDGDRDRHARHRRGRGDGRRDRRDVRRTDRRDGARPRRC